MNYYEARQEQRDGQPTGIWRWTCQNDNQIWTAAPCTAECQHASAEEAVRHYYDDLRADLVEGGVSWTACSAPDCDQPANKTLGPRRAWSKQDALCDAHRTPEMWEALHPFAAGLQVISS